MVALIPGAGPDPDTVTDLSASVPCNTTVTISFVFGGVEYPLHPSDWVEKSYRDDRCRMRIRAQRQDSNSFRLGTQFLGAVYTVLKFAPTPQIGFALKSARRTRNACHIDGSA